MARAETIRASPRVRISALPADRGAVETRRPPWIILGVAQGSWVARARPSPLWPPPVEPGAPGDPSTPALYRLRITHRDQLADLPGLDERAPDGAPLPSLLRDSAALALAGGAESVEVGLATWRDARPWQYAYEADTSGFDPLFNELFRRYLEQRPGTLITLPDAAGPASLADLPEGWRVNTTRWSASTRAALWRANVEPLLPLLDEHRQIAVLDAPTGLTPTALHEVMAPLLGQAVAVCAWTGSRRALAAHAWRAASVAVAAGLLGVSGDGVRPGGLLNRRLSLGPGRSPSVPVPTHETAPEVELDAHLIHLQLLSDGISAGVVQEPTLLRPMGRWPLTAVWTARLIVARVAEIAETFVFRLSNPAAAIELQIALLRGLSPFIREGVLASGDASTDPRIETRAPTDRGAPRLEAIVEAVLRPWTINLDLSVEISGFGPPVVRVG